MTTKTPSISSRKVLVHALPPLLTREEFIAQLPEAWLLQPSHTVSISKEDLDREKKCKLLLYVRGEISKQRDVVDFSRAYIILETAVAVKRFCEELHGTTFVTSSTMPAGSSSSLSALKSTNAVVELAPVARLPSKPVLTQPKRGGKRRGRNNRRGGNGGADPPVAPPEVPLEINPFFLKFLKLEEEAKLMPVKAKTLLVTNNTTNTTKATNANNTNNTNTTNNANNSKDVRSWRRGGASSTDVRSNTTTSQVPAPVSSAATTAPPAPVSHLVAQIIARRQREEREQRMRQQRLKRRQISVRGLQTKSKRDRGESKRKGRRKKGSTGTYVPPPQRTKGGGGGLGSGGGGGGGSSSGGAGAKNTESRAKKKKKKTRRGRSGKKTAGDDGWTTINSGNSSKSNTTKKKAK
jgi:hypothetical protein